MKFYDIIMLVITVIFGGLSLYLRTKTNLLQQVNSAIVNAEHAYSEVTHAGNMKFNYVVTRLYSLVPAPFKTIITQEMIGRIVQNAFNSIENYAVQQLDKITDGIVKPSEKTDTDGE